MDPANAKLVAREIAAKLGELSPKDAAAFQENLKSFEAKVDDGLKRWTAQLAPFAGAKFASYHKNLPYFAQRFGLVSDGEIEPKPGIPPTAAHTAELIERMKTDGVKLILTQAFYEDRTPASIARAAGARVITVAMAPGGVPEAQDYLGMMDYNVRSTAQALEAAGAGKAAADGQPNGRAAK
jgi:zinc/manganese transport system substrate-binding protein